MYRIKVGFLVFLLCGLPITKTKANPVTDSKKVNAPTISITGLDVHGETLKLSYEIRNDSQQDIWILAGLGKSDAVGELFMRKDNETIVIRRRLDVPRAGGDGTVYGRYVLMCPGAEQNESLSIALPVYPDYIFASRRKPRGLECATELAIEIGYYSADLPMKIQDTLCEADREGRKTITDDDRTRYFYFRGTLYYNKLSEALRQRNEELLLPYTEMWFKGEKLIQATIQGLTIPYEEKEEWLNPDIPSLPPCTRLEIHCHPSPLEYFFPFRGQRNLLSSEERKDLRTLTNIHIADSECIKSFARDLSLGRYTNGLVFARYLARIMCYRENEQLMTTTIYNDESIVTEGRFRFSYKNNFRSLRLLTPQIRPIELRIQCAANLRNLWHRLRLYYKAIGQIETSYPEVSEWCDIMKRAYERAYENADIHDNIMKPHKCPSASEGKNNYALNPSCKYDSPPDMVLLFETKAGWNQHGGPELFTFDNHDPKGGCVLFNDGTVKFIRTKEELQQLRWK